MQQASNLIGIIHIIFSRSIGQSNLYRNCIFWQVLKHKLICPVIAYAENKIVVFIENVIVGRRSLVDIAALNFQNLIPRKHAQPVIAGYFADYV